MAPKVDLQAAEDESQNRREMLKALMANVAILPTPTSWEELIRLQETITRLAFAGGFKIEDIPMAVVPTALIKILSSKPERDVSDAAHRVFTTKVKMVLDTFKKEDETNFYGLPYTEQWRVVITNSVREDQLLRLSQSLDGAVLKYNRVMPDYRQMLLVVKDMELAQALGLPGRTGAECAKILTTFSIRNAVLMAKWAGNPPTNFIVAVAHIMEELAQDLLVSQIKPAAAMVVTTVAEDSGPKGSKTKGDQPCARCGKGLHAVAGCKAYYCRSCLTIGAHESNQMCPSKSSTVVVGARKPPAGSVQVVGIVLAKPPVPAHFTDIGVDTMANQHVFGNSKLLTNVKDTEPQTIAMLSGNVTSKQSGTAVITVAHPSGDIKITIHNVRIVTGSKSNLLSARIMAEEHGWTTQIGKGPAESHITVDAAHSPVHETIRIPIVVGADDNQHYVGNKAVSLLSASTQSPPSQPA